MVQRESRPPLDLSDIEDEPIKGVGAASQEAPRSGRLSYAGSAPKRSSNGGGGSRGDSGGMKAVQMLVTIVVTLALVIGFLSQMYYSKNNLIQYLNMVTADHATLTTQEATIKADSARLDSTLGTIATLAKQSGLDSLSSSLTSYETATDAKVKALAAQTAVDSLQTAVTKLQTDTKDLATTAALASALAEYVKSSTLADYVKNTDLVTSLKSVTDRVTALESKPVTAVSLTSVSSSSVVGTIGVAGSYHIILNLYGTNGGAPSASTSIGTVGQSYVLAGASTTTTYSGFASFTSGSNVVSITGSWPVSTTTISDGTHTYSILGVFGTSILISTPALATIASPYSIIVTVPSTQADLVIVLNSPTGGWVIGSTFTITPTQLTIGIATVESAP